VSNFRLLAFDLDGTVLSGGKGPSAVTLDALKAAKAAGCRIAVCTGRPERLIPQSVGEIPFLDYLVTANGAMVRELKNNRILSTISLSKEAAYAVCRRAKQDDAGLQVHFRQADFIDLKSWFRTHRYMNRSGMKESFRKRWQDTSRYFSILPSVHRIVQRTDKPIIKMACIYRSKEECKSHLELFSDIKGIEAASAIGIDIEITAKEATKGRALDILCRELSIDNSGVFAIGDSENDISMRTYTGCLVAMGNAAQGLASVADYITESVYNDGAAKAIYQYVCGVKPT
jgi:Cof subfamily protein (haloacid dehalogenase superfamily)